MPIVAAAVDVAIEWGSTPFLFTGPTTPPSLPATRVLTTELMRAVPDTVWTWLGSAAFATETMVGLLRGAGGGTGVRQAPRCGDYRSPLMPC
jgi:hypothetical protein